MKLMEFISEFVNFSKVQSIIIGNAEQGEDSLQEYDINDIPPNLMNSNIKRNSIRVQKMDYSHTISLLVE